MSSKISRSGSVELIEYATVSSRVSVRDVERPERLHEWLTIGQINELHRLFRSFPSGKLTYQHLRDSLENVDIKFTDLEYNRLFLKINQNRDFKCDWNEFISYLIFGFQEDDPSTSKEALILPISMPPTAKRSEHRSSICTTCLLRPYRDDENADSNLSTGDTPEGSGMWLTASHEGQVRFWTTNLELIRTATSQSLHMKMSTWILAMQALSDVTIVVISSTERELRFHETIAATFTLRMVMRLLPFAVCVMSYSFNPTGKTNSKLILGDYGGNVRIVEFPPYLRGPFQSKPGAALVEVLWSDVVKGKLPLIKVKEYLNVHSELIRCVFFSMKMNVVFSAAEYRNTKKYRGRCPGLVKASGEEKATFRIPLGVTTFFVDERDGIVVTGGPDSHVRVWDVFLSSNPIGVLTGHNGGVVMVLVQPAEKKVYSVDYQKIIKVWHLTEYTLLQTYGDLVNLMPLELDLVYNYHPSTRELIVGGRQLISVKLCPRIRVDLTDGNTHSKPISVVLYNRLFRNLVTCGLDSYIIVWDPWTGRRKVMMKNCHTKMMYGELINIEITAACFDPLEQFLLTGARDGSLKIWNYNNAVCIRNMSIMPEHEVTSVIWVVERILAVGWDQQVTEFNDVQGREYGDPKKWKKFHTDDITCADVMFGEGIVTATYSGELIFWRLETGQPYRRYLVADPHKFIELKYNPEGSVKKTNLQGGHVNVSRFVRKSISDNIRSMETTLRKSARVSTKSNSAKLVDEAEELKMAAARLHLSVLPLSVQAVLFLQTRPLSPEHGTLLVALDNGVVQVYSHHRRGGYLRNFVAVHKTGDCVLTMTTDRKNRYLITGSAFGYIKVWLMENFCVPESEKKHICMPLLRLQFIFLRKERWLPRAKRIVRHQPEPMLLSSYKGHLKAINTCVYINLPKILVTGSHDCSCRLWSLGGRYLGTLGTPLPWPKLTPFVSVDESQPFRLPPDIKKVASSTSMKVMSGVQEDRLKMAFNLTQMEDETAEEDEATRLYGKPLVEPVLGKHFTLPGRSAFEQRVELDTSMSYIPVYQHLKIPQSAPILRPPTPPAIHRINKEDYMDYYQPSVKVKVEPRNVRMMAHKTKSPDEDDEEDDGSDDLQLETIFA